MLLYPSLDAPKASELAFKDKYKYPNPQAEIPIDYYESKTDIFIDADLPGVDKSNISLTIDNTGLLKIHAKRSELEHVLNSKQTEEPKSVMERVESEMKFYILERSAENLCRSIPLPANADRF